MEALLAFGRDVNIFATYVLPFLRPQQILELQQVNKRFYHIVIPTYYNLRRGYDPREHDDSSWYELSDEEIKDWRDPTFVKRSFGRGRRPPY